MSDKENQLLRLIEAVIPSLGSMACRLGKSGEKRCATGGNCLNDGQQPAEEGGELLIENLQSDNDRGRCGQRVESWSLLAAQRSGNDPNFDLLEITALVAGRINLNQKRQAGLSAWLFFAAKVDSWCGERIRFSTTRAAPAELPVANRDGSLEDQDSFSGS